MNADPDDFNPYEAPQFLAPDLPSMTVARRLGRWGLPLAWFAVCALNLVGLLPLGLDLADRRGRIGIFAASILLFVVGFRICAGARTLARPLIVGGVPVGLSQVVPLLQIMAGMVGLMVGEALGLVKGWGDVETPWIEGIAGGFLVTLITGALLMGAALAAGLLIRAFTPARWWGDPAETPIMVEE